MVEELLYKHEAAAGYDLALAQVSMQFIPTLLRAAKLTSGMRVLDIATGTGLAAEAALAIVGPNGHVTAADVAPAMVEKARERLGTVRNARVVVEDGQRLSFEDASFDAVLCGLGLMFFQDAGRGLSEFYRVLRPGGHAAVSVNTVPQRSFNTRINIIIGRYAPSLAEAAARLFSLGQEERLRLLFEAAGFRNVEFRTEIHRFVVPTFDAYFEPFEKGAGSSGQAFVSLPIEVRRAVREEVRRDLGDNGGPINIDVEVRFASGQH
jgi:ubiquinone/menaquinone biosynthesis C-methylase UbiE